jgi:formylglycine-generating enzyme required for sulfatase activity/serine/threonine protein kinase
VRVIGQRYELQAEIASGGMASVHLARQVGAAGYSRIVAVKRLHERYARDPDFVAMFLDEARLVARIRHPNVVQTLDVVTEQGTAQGELFIVMEYVHGESLLKLLSTATLKGHAVPPRIAAAIITAVLHGLHEAHEARDEMGQPLGIVHRDVSPHNVLVGADGVARVIDFGVAKASSRITTTTEGQLKGKLSYMAPEQVTARPIDRRTDVYAAAVVLWELLTGAKLFHGPSEGAVIQQILAARIVPPSGGNPAVPTALDGIVTRGLSADPEKRFQTALEMAVAVGKAIDSASVVEVSAWVRETCGREIEMKSQIISAIEAKSSSKNLREAVEGLRALSRGSSVETPVIPGGTVPPPVNPSQRPWSSPSHPVLSSSLYPPAGATPSGQVQSLLPPPSNSGPVPTASRRGPILAIGGVIILACALLGGVLGIRARNQAVAKRASDASANIAAATPSPPVSAATTTAAATLPALDCPQGMVRVPGGRFFMGSDDDLPKEKPAHNVTIPSFCMDRFEVSTDAYRACSDRGDCKRAGTTNRWEGITAKEQKTFDPVCNFAASARGKHPINCVDWSMADRFCRAEGKRLPTEAEWEFAARGSDGRKFPWGDTRPTSKHLNACGKECVRWLDQRGAQNDGSLYPEDDSWATTAPIGSFPSGSTRWGAEDMVGNVWEWVADWSGPYTAEDQTSPEGPKAGTARVIRGGAWNGAYPDWVRPSFRYESAPDTRSHGIGFRCAK